MITCTPAKTSEELPLPICRAREYDYAIGNLPLPLMRAMPPRQALIGTSKRTNVTVKKDGTAPKRRSFVEGAFYFLGAMI